jgi:hypothetical protein
MKGLAFKHVPLSSRGIAFGCIKISFDRVLDWSGISTPLHAHTISGLGCNPCGPTGNYPPEAVPLS